LVRCEEDCIAQRLPVFAATNLRRIPTVTPNTDVDACAMAATMAQLRGDVTKMNSQHDALSKQINEVLLRLMLLWI